MCKIFGAKIAKISQMHENTTDVCGYDAQAHQARAWAGALTPCSNTHLIQSCWVLKEMHTIH